ncbi:LytTR family transcriptional regulator [Roseibacterium beibuensis]|uniref:LytTR family DNA-binding domain-containing protein n=1 Tax=[Roseibacterium] beibuensis TaxID=1193142 RepID=UPI00217DAA90|nr:LytTR family DNA-binding domain-containing protein [Roseibacterium beibuensis]MCS6625407.1 LytTR family transcriptional regulator [Roseibacterium beibuensis]
MKRIVTDPRTVWLLGLTFTGLFYAIVIDVSRDAPLLSNLQGAALNVGSLAITALAARAVLRRWILRLDGWAMWAAHVALSIGFTLTWAWVLYVLTGISQGSAMRFTVVPFLEGPAQQWQLMQGMFAYAAVAALNVVEHRPVGTVLVLDNTQPGFRERFLVRDDGEVLTLTADEIISVIGADDYAEIITLDGTRLVSTTLGELEAVLDPRRFLRVHRSAIANLDHVKRAEPIGGGRMTLSLTAGPDLAVSRTGAKLLRERLL